MTVRPIFSCDDAGNQTAQIGSYWPASGPAVARLMAEPISEHNGRSPWYWFRLSDGTLILGTLPLDGGYFACENDVATDYCAAQET